MAESFTGQITNILLGSREGQTKYVVTGNAVYYGPQNSPANFTGHATFTTNNTWNSLVFNTKPSIESIEDFWFQLSYNNKNQEPTTEDNSQINVVLALNVFIKEGDVITPHTIDALQCVISHKNTYTLTFRNINNILIPTNGALGITITATTSTNATYRGVDLAFHGYHTVA